MTYTATVPVTTHVPGPLYRALELEARKSRRRVGDLLVEHAAESINVDIVMPKPRRTWNRMSDDRLLEAALLWNGGCTQTQIANTLGLSRSTMRNHWQRVVTKAQTISEEQAA